MKFPKWVKSEELEYWKTRAKLSETLAQGANDLADFWSNRAQQAELRLIELGEPVGNTLISSTTVNNLYVGTHLGNNTNS